MAKISGAAHPATGLAVLASVGGIVGYVKGGLMLGKSVPSLVAGLTFGSLYAASANLINKNADWGIELATATSATLAGAMLPRAIKTRKPVPVALSMAGILGLAYYGRKLYEQYA